MLTLSELGVVCGVTLLTASVVMYLLRPGDLRPAQVEVPVFDPLSLLFDDGVLHHGTNAALRRFALLPGTHVWSDLQDVLLSRFPDFPDTAGTGASGSIRLLSNHTEDTALVEINWRDGLCWVHLSEADAQDKIALPFPKNHNAPERCCETLSHPAWETDSENRIIWHNPAFTRVLGASAEDAEGILAELPIQKDPIRVALGQLEGADDCYEVTSHKTSAGLMHHATCISPLVRAEEAQRIFVQTLAKTFAHLSIGLAIFDRGGQLGIFNPALVDLTGLPANFLAAQPTMLSFFDALRENRRMPEPKNYRTWRQDITDVIAAASGGQYRETWMLEDGRTFVVQGRPHPDGATAFLIEDISAEVTLSRSFRADMEQFEDLLDTFDDALVVFSSSGILTFCNAAYRRMWGQDPDAAFADVTLLDSATLWAEKALAEDNWQAVKDLGSAPGTPQGSSFGATLKDGTALQCTLLPLGPNAIFLRFSKVGGSAPLVRKEEMEQQS